MDSLDQYPWFALHRYSLDTSSTFQLIGWKSTYFCRHAIDCWSIDISWLTLNQLSIKCWSRYLPSINWNIHHVSIEMSIKGRLTLHQHLGWESTNFCRHAIECRLMDISWLTLDQLSIKHWSRYLLGIDWGVLQVSIKIWIKLIEMPSILFNTLPKMSLVHVIQLHLIINQPFQLTINSAQQLI